MIRLNHPNKEYAVLREVGTMKEVHEWEEKGFVLLQAGIRKGKHYFVMGKNPLRSVLLEKPSGERFSGKMEKLAKEQLEQGNQLVQLARVGVSLFAVGMGLFVIFLGWTSADPVQPLMSRTWNVAMMAVGLALLLLGLFELVQVLILKRREKIFSKLLEDS